MKNMNQKNNSYVNFYNHYINIKKYELFDFNIKKISSKILNFVVKKFEFNFICYIDLSLVSNYKIKKINNLYRHINKTTDVLSFPNFNFYKPLKFINLNFENRDIFLGDVIISADKVISQSKKYNHTIYREYCFLLLHSILHLFGYDHINTFDEKIMFSLQDTILNDLGIKK